MSERKNSAPPGGFNPRKDQMSAPVDAVVHTPGQWRFYDIYGGDYHEVFGPASPGSDRVAVTSKADARLIAAAPDLLKACKIALYALRCAGIQGRSPETDTIESAIVKATGKAG